MSAAFVYVPRLSCSGLLPLLETLRSAGRSDPVFSQITVSEILCALLMNNVSISCSPLRLLKVNPASLQSQMLWELIFPCTILGLRSLM